MAESSKSIKSTTSANLRRSTRIRNVNNTNKDGNIQKTTEKKIVKNNDDFYKVSGEHGQGDTTDSEQHSQSEANVPHTEKNNVPIFSITIIILVIASICTFLYLLKGNKTETSKVNFGFLKTNFKTQSNRTWNILKSSTDHIITAEEPDRPAVIMMVLPNFKSQPMALCLAQHLSQDLNKILNGQSMAAVSYPFIDSSEFVRYETGEQKIKIDNSIQHITKHHNSVIITHLEKLHSKTVMFFHGLCDTTEALNKRIAVIFLLETSSEITNESALALYLEKLWRDIDHIKIKPLLARLANNVVFLNQDKGFTNC